MSGYAYARRGARVVACVLALGAAGAAAQQVPSENPAENSAQSASPPAAKESDTVKPVNPAAPQATTPSTAPTSNLPELVVDGQDKKKKTTVAKDKAYVAPTTGEATTAEPPPPGVTLGTTAKSDTGTTTFDANNVKMRTDGGGDANTFMRNLPNVQYQNQASDGGAGSQKSIDTKPALLSISGGRTYENNFMLNGVSISNITGPTERSGGALNDATSTAVIGTIYGQSPQNIYVPTEFIGQATVIDSNASAEYGQFQGGVVLYDLVAPPTDRYHASVSASRDTSEFANFILGTPDGTNPGKRLAPTYEKTTLSASVGAPITRDFSFIAQASRKEAESSKQMFVGVGDGFLPENSDNIFLRFAASARTDIGKFTLDTSHTDYFQRWVNFQSLGDVYVDTNTQGSSTKLDYEGKLPGVHIDEVGLGRAKLTARAFYNTNETQNNGGDSNYMTWNKQVLNPAPPGSVVVYEASALDWCRGIQDPASYPVTSNTAITCVSGGYGNLLQGQTDYGAQANLTGDVLLGSFKVGTELKQYVGRRARMENFSSTTNRTVIDTNGSINGTGVPGPAGGFDCQGDPLCNPGQFGSFLVKVPAYDNSVTLNALHAYTEIDQTWKWFNVRAGARLDYDDYFKNINIAPRLAGTITPFEGLSFTGGFNTYYLGESLYYALRDNEPAYRLYTRGFNPDGTLTPANPVLSFGQYVFKTEGLNTPYQDEYTGVVRITDPLFGGELRGKYLERYGRDQFATVGCGTSCTTTSNDGESFYRSASAEYTKEWHTLNTPFYLNAAAITGNVTWSEQRTSQTSYLITSDVDGDGVVDNPIYYNGAKYAPGAFDAVTGNLDIPVRFGATLATVWFDDILELNFNAGVNLGYQGVYLESNSYTDASAGCAPCAYYKDKQFGATLKLDVSGQINVTEQAAIQFSANNITNSAQNTIVTNDNPWVLGRSYWLGSSLRF